MLDVWRNVLAEIEQSISSSQFSTWFAGVELVSMDDGIIVIGVPNIFKRSQIQSRYSDVIKTAFEHNDVTVQEVRYDMLSTKKSTKELVRRQESIKATVQPSPTVKISTGLNPRYTLDNFIIGSNNDLAVSVANNIVEQPGEKYNPFFLYGGPGLGKPTWFKQSAMLLWKNTPNYGYYIYQFRVFIQNLLSRFATIAVRAMNSDKNL